MITLEQLKEKVEKLGYIASEELLYDTFNALCMFYDGQINPGQDIFAICLEGPPGAGKTEFAKIYTKVCGELLTGTIEMVDYQCDATTGKTDLFEDINISAAIRGDADHVNIPGKLIEAIKKVNSGQKVILFIDEYDKAREETDAFLLQFLQSGKINSTQHGDLEIREEYKSNLQVILCKNDMREELSGPLSRRLRMIRLDSMEPSTFYQVAQRSLVENRKDPVNDGLLNLVTLMYQQIYASREIYNRIPSCSEMLIALLDADRLLKRANAPQYIIYNTIIRNMFKSIDDINTFEKSITKSTDENAKKLATLISKMQSHEEESKENLNELIARTIFTSETAKLQKKTAEMDALIEEYKMKFAQMEEARKQAIAEEIEKIILKNGKFVSTNTIPNVMSLFEDEGAYIKRGVDIFGLSSTDWIDVAEIKIPNLSIHLFTEQLVEHASALGIKIYENGILIGESEKQKLIVINDLGEDKKPRYRIMSNYLVLPSSYIADIKNLITFALDVYNSQPKTAGQITNQVIEVPTLEYNINALMYNDSNLELPKEQEHVYHVNMSGTEKSLDSLYSFLGSLSFGDPLKAIEASNELAQAKRKVI